MSDIQITLNRAQIREVVAAVRERIGQGPVSQDLADVDQKLRAALPPEYPEGTVAWVTHRTIKTYRRLAHMHNGHWTFDHDETGVDHSLAAGDILKVEPLRILADDEIAVKHPGSLYLRPAADILERRNFVATAGWVRSVADALDAEQK